MGFSSQTGNCDRNLKFRHNNPWMRQLDKNKKADLNRIRKHNTAENLILLKIILESKRYICNQYVKKNTVNSTKNRVYRLHLNSNVLRDNSSFLQTRKIL